MSTIEIILSTDSPSTSIGDINANFAALNTDKIEADSTDVLENKTIDVDDNTLSNIETDNVKTASKTGVDLKFVTGTKGNENEVAIWNSDGDLISSGLTIEEIQDEFTSSKQFFVPVLKHSADADTYSSNVGNYAVVQMDSGEDCYFFFVVPDDFNGLTSVEILMIPDATETISLDFNTNFGGSGESPTVNGVVVSNHTQAVTATTLTKVRIDNNAAAPFAGLAAGDLTTIFINSDQTMLRVLGLLVKYN